jgi:8-oxo-dGTP pyrophosphatase MutT (NUDIX family)
MASSILFNLNSLIIYPANLLNLRLLIPLLFLEPFINKLKAQLQHPLPGQEAQYRMAPVARTRFDIEKLSPGQFKPSAVMILLCDDGMGNRFIPLTLRPPYIGAHGGQVSLPGGKFDEADGDLEHTAMRECYEEIGVKDNIELLGTLTRLYIPVSHFMVTPFVGICHKSKPVFIPHEREVKSIVRLNIGDLLSVDSVKQGSVAVDASNTLQMDAPYFLSEEYKIWGATAMILSELKAVLESIS